MTKKLNIKNIWMESFALLIKNPIIIAPFVLIAFFESLSLELIYFSTRKPISFIAGPVIKKFFGEAFLHYPYNLSILPKLFYYSQLAIYIFISVYLMAISINIFKNVSAGLPLKIGALIKNASKKCLSFFLFGILIIISIFILEKGSGFLFSKIGRFGMKHISWIKPEIYFVSFMLGSFLLNIIMQTFFILTIPIVVINKTPLLKAIIKSIVLGFRNFLPIFILILLPYLVYLPIFLLKSFSSNLGNKFFPEIGVCIIICGIFLSIIVDCFIILCASRFLLEKGKLADPK